MINMMDLIYDMIYDMIIYKNINCIKTVVHIVIKYD